MDVEQDVDASRVELLDDRLKRHARVGKVGGLDRRIVLQDIAHALRIGAGQGLGHQRQADEVDAHRLELGDVLVVRAATRVPEDVAHVLFHGRAARVGLVV